MKGKRPTEWWMQPRNLWLIGFVLFLIYCALGIPVPGESGVWLQ